MSCSVFSAPGAAQISDSLLQASRSVCRTQSRRKESLRSVADLGVEVQERLHGRAPERHERHARAQHLAGGRMATVVLITTLVERDRDRVNDDIENKDEQIFIELATSLDTLIEANGFNTKKNRG